LQDAEGKLAPADARLQTISDGVAQLGGSIGETDRRLTEMQGEAAKFETKFRDHWRNISDQARRLGLLINETRRRMPEPLSAEEISVFASEGEKELSALYVTFEDRYRGSRQDITQRQTVYLPYARQAAEKTGKKAFLDIGCGRGEFVELLRANGLTGRGVDQNPVMVAECRERGLDAVEADALAFLRKAAPASLAGVSGFHIIEHVPHRVLVDLFDEALRALAPGGLLIFETPNPANLLVAAERFYLDPTHLNPLPSEMVAFMAEARGFVRITVLPLHPVANKRRKYDDAMLALLQEKIYGPQDYGLVAWKAQ
jgi:O-antigen chain-terminating methyltransferase